MTEANAYMGYNDAIARVRSSKPDGREGNALVGKFSFIIYHLNLHSRSSFRASF